MAAKLTEDTLIGESGRGSDLSGERARERTNTLKIVGRTATVFGGQTFYSALRFLAILLIRRSVSPEAFSEYATYLSTFLVVSNLCDMGLNTSCIRFGAAAKDSRTEHEIYRRFLGIRMIVAILVAACFWIAAPAICGRMLQRPEYLLCVRLAALAAALLSIGQFPVTILRAQSHFSAVAWLTALSSVPFLAPMILALRSSSHVAFLFAADAAGAILVLIITRKTLLGLARRSRTVIDHPPLRELFLFARWIAASIAIGAVYNYIPTLTLAHLPEKAAIGDFILGFTLANVITLVMNASLTVYMPEAMKLDSARSARRYVRSSAKSSLAVCVPLAIVVWLTPVAGSMLHASKHYQTSFMVFMLVGTAQLLVMTTNPIQLLLYTWNKPRIGAAADSLIALLFFVGSWMAASRYGAIGVAAAFFAAQSGVKLFLTAWVVGEIPRWNPSGVRAG